MSDGYRRVLHEWAARKLGDKAARVTNVIFTFEPGAAWSSWTVESPNFEIRVDYELQDGTPEYRIFDDDDEANMGVLLQQLFALADEIEPRSTEQDG